LPICSTTTNTRDWRARCCAHHRRVSRCRSCEHHACEDGGCSCSMHACQALADSTPWRAHVGPLVALVRSGYALVLLTPTPTHPPTHTHTHTHTHVGRKVQCAHETGTSLCCKLVKSVAPCCAPIRLGYPISDTTSPENGGDAARNQPRSWRAKREEVWRRGSTPSWFLHGHWPHPFLSVSSDSVSQFI
jgi:hypothetical protein